MQLLGLSMTDEKIKDDAFWRDKLSPEEFHVCREKGTEKPFTGRYWDEKRDGQYHCRCCTELLFTSNAKFDAHCGWPSFYQAANKENIVEVDDSSHGMIRTEVVCGKCGSHLGHVFPDGPEPSGMRYCINSLSISLELEGQND